MIVFNGQSGGIGRYVESQANLLGLRAVALRSRLGDVAGLRKELDAAAGSAQTIEFIHLAAKVSVSDCEADPEAAELTNVTQAAVTCEAAIGWAFKRNRPIRIVFVSTGHVYAAQPFGTRITEASPLAPRSVYATTKLRGERAVTSVAHSENVPLTIARVFGLIGPQQAASYVLPGLIRRSQSCDLVAVPGLDYFRDYLDARDVARTLVELTVLPIAPATVNVCSGSPTSIRKILTLAVAETAPAGCDIRSATPGPGRPDDIAWLVGDPGQAEELLGHGLCTIDLPTTVHDAVAALAS